MLPTLDARLTAAAQLVRPGQPVADIGCDHGKLTAVLAASGKYPKVIGADLRPGPLAKAKQTLENAGCLDRAELRLGDGLSVLSAGEVGSIVLAGVSAQTTWEIIEKAPWVSAVGGPRLVMVPATRHSELRRWLWQGCNHFLGSIRLCFKGKLVDLAVDRSLREQVLAIFIIAITGQINTYIIQCMNQAFLSRLTLGHQHNVFCSGVCVALCNTGFKPILHFCNHRDIVVDCQKRKIRHLRVDVQVDACLIDTCTQFNLLAVSFKN